MNEELELIARETAARTPGIYTLPANEYHAWSEALSPSKVHRLCSESPLHAKTRTYEESTEMDLGTIAHAMILEGEWKAEVLDFENWRTKAAREARDAARTEGRTPILKHQAEAVHAMVGAFNTQIAEFSEFPFPMPGKPEQSIVWQEKNGVWCRGRIDWLADSYKAIADLKTTGMSANPDVFSRSMFTGGLDIAAAWYMRGVQSLTGIEPVFRFVVVETQPPYAVSVIGIGPDVLTLAQKKIMYAVDVWKGCLDTGDFPGYPKQVCYPELPGWAEGQWLAKEMREIV